MLYKFLTISYVFNIQINFKNLNSTIKLVTKCNLVFKTHKSISIKRMEAVEDVHHFQGAVEVDFISRRSRARQVSSVACPSHITSGPDLLIYSC